MSDAPDGFEAVYEFAAPPDGTDPDEARAMIRAQVGEAGVPAEIADRMTEEMWMAWLGGWRG